MLLDEAYSAENRAHYHLKGFDDATAAADAYKKFDAERDKMISALAERVWSKMKEKSRDPEGDLTRIRRDVSLKVSDYFECRKDLLHEAGRRQGTVASEDMLRWEKEGWDKREEEVKEAENKADELDKALEDKLHQIDAAIRQQDVKLEEMKAAIENMKKRGEELGKFGNNLQAAPEKSKEFKRMDTAMKNYQVQATVENMEEIRNAARDYLAAKQHGLHLGTSLRYRRLAYAQELMDFADRSMETLRDIDSNVKDNIKLSDRFNTLKEKQHIYTEAAQDRGDLIRDRLSENDIPTADQMHAAWKKNCDDFREQIGGIMKGTVKAKDIAAKFSPKKEEPNKANVLA